MKRLVTTFNILLLAGLSSSFAFADGHAENERTANEAHHGAPSEAQEAQAHAAEHQQALIGAEQRERALAHRACVKAKAEAKADAKADQEESVGALPTTPAI